MSSQRKATFLLLLLTKIHLESSLESPFLHLNSDGSKSQADGGQMNVDRVTFRAMKLCDGERKQVEEVFA